jgi:hypothetical protein
VNRLQPVPRFASGDPVGQEVAVDIDDRARPGRAGEIE